jgi:hypothetical protein
MNPYELAQIQQQLGNNAPANLGNMRMSQIMGNLPPEARAAMARASTQQSLANKPQGMDVPQTYLWAMANHISPAQLGLTAGQIYASEQGLAGYHMDPQTGQITKANPAAPGGREAVNPQTLGAAINTNLGGSFGMENGQMVRDAAWINNAPGSYNIQPGQSGYGNAPGGAGAAVNNLGGGAGNPNNAAGQGGLYGAAGNAIRQQMMDSQQFNPNGANTYAIQNMNLSGQGGLGSNMGGMPSNGLYPSQTTPPAGATPIPQSPTPYTGAVGQSGQSAPVLNNNGGGGQAPGTPYTTAAANQAQQAMGAMTPYQTRTSTPSAPNGITPTANPAASTYPTAQPRTTTPYQLANPTTPNVAGSHNPSSPNYFGGGGGTPLANRA